MFLFFSTQAVLLTMALLICFDLPILNSSPEVKGVLKTAKSSHLLCGRSWLSSDVLKKLLCMHQESNQTITFDFKCFFFYLDFFLLHSKTCWMKRNQWRVIMNKTEQNTSAHLND